MSDTASGRRTKEPAISFSDAHEEETLTDMAADLVAQFGDCGAFAPQEHRLEAKRDPGERPDGKADPLNALIRLCDVSIPGAQGPLRGMKIGIKDNIAIAGVPMTCGSGVLEDFVPSFDSAVVSRVLRAGGQIRATTNMDCFSTGAGGDTSYFGPTKNPFDPERATGGSSAGSAAALSYDYLDLCLGGDQGGSIRLPASWCGVVGLKPTRGLVPTSGVVGMDRHVDHVGPLGRTAGEVAALLDAVANLRIGDDTDDLGGAEPYSEAVGSLGRGLGKWRFGLLQEAFDPANGVDAESARVTTEAAQRLTALGAETQPISLPLHMSVGPIAFILFAYGFLSLLRGDDTNISPDRPWPEATRAILEGMDKNAQTLSPQARLLATLGSALEERHGPPLYREARAGTQMVRQMYDAALEEVDFLVLPTAMRLPYRISDSVSLEDAIGRSWGTTENTMQFNVSGHPAISLPTSSLDGLPVGMMIVGRWGSDADLLFLAGEYERNFGWQPR